MLNSVEKKSHMAPSGVHQGVKTGAFWGGPAGGLQAKKYMFALSSKMGVG